MKAHVHVGHDTSEQIELGGHKLQFGGGPGDGYCYGHQSFACIDTLSKEEWAAIRAAEEAH